MAMPRRKGLIPGALASFGLWPKNLRAFPEPGAKPYFIGTRPDEAKPRRTSDGKAETIKPVTFVEGRVLNRFS
jgi:hypothetical protein